jgi:hypothetical protein
MKSLHFDTIVVIEAESQNTASKMHLKNGRSAINSPYTWRGDYFVGDGGQ